MRVVLNKNERQLARYIGGMRSSTNRDRGIEDKKRSNKKGVEIDTAGFAGELVVARLLNLYPDFGMEATNQADLTFRGHSIDVKTSKYPTARLLAPPHKADKDYADIFMLVTGEMPSFTVRGWIRGDELVTRDRLVEDFKGYGPAYVVPQSELHPLGKLNELKLKRPA